MNDKKINENYWKHKQHQNIKKKYEDYLEDNQLQKNSDSAGRFATQILAGNTHYESLTFDKLVELLTNS